MKKKANLLEAVHTAGDAGTAPEPQDAEDRPQGEGQGRGLLSGSCGDLQKKKKIKILNLLTRR